MGVLWNLRCDLLQLRGWDGFEFGGEEAQFTVDIAQNGSQPLKLSRFCPCDVAFLLRQVGVLIEPMT